MPSPPGFFYFRPVALPPLSEKSLTARRSGYSRKSKVSQTLELCGATALCPAERGDGFRFAGPLQLGDYASLWEETLERAGRLCEVVDVPEDKGVSSPDGQLVPAIVGSPSATTLVPGLAELAQLGVRRYCWLMPNEEATPRGTAEVPFSRPSLATR